MAVSHVLTHTFAQEIANDSSLTIAPSGTVPVGDLLVLAILMQANRSVSTVTDTGGNTWTEHCDTVNGTIETLSIWTCPVTTQLTTGSTITITFGSSTAAKTALLEQFTGTVPTGSWVDEGIVTASGSSTGPTVTAGAATSFADSMLFGICVYDGTGAAFTPSASPLSFTELEDVNQTNGGTRRNIASFWDLPGSTVTAAYAGTLSSSRNWIIAGLAFLADSGGTSYAEDLALAGTSALSLTSEVALFPETVVQVGTAALSLPTELRIDAETLVRVGTGSVSLSSEIALFPETLVHVGTATLSLPVEAQVRAEMLTILQSPATASLSAETFLAVETLLAAANAPPSLVSQFVESVETLALAGTSTLSLTSEVYDPAAGAEYPESLALAGTSSLSLSSELRIDAELVSRIGTSALLITPDVAWFPEAVVQIGTSTLSLPVEAQVRAEMLALAGTSTLSLPTELRNDAELVSRIGPAALSLPSEEASFPETVVRIGTSTLSLPVETYVPPSLAMVARVRSHTPAQSLSNSSTLTQTIAATVPVGNVLILPVLSQGGTVTVTSVTDSKGNTWTEQMDQFHGTIMGCSLHYCRVTTQLLATDTITITFSSSSAAKTSLLEEYTGVKSSGTYIHTGATGANTSASPGAGSVGVVATGDNEIQIVWYDGVGGAYSPPVQSGWIERQDVVQDNVGIRRNIAYADHQGLPAGENAGFGDDGSLSSSRNWIAMTISLVADPDVELVAAVGTGSLSLPSQKRRSYVQNRRLTIARATVASDQKYVSYLDIPEGGNIYQIGIEMDGQGGGAGSQWVRGILYSDSAGLPGTLLAEGNSETSIPAGQTTIERLFQFNSNPVVNPGRVWVGIHGSATTLVSRTLQQSEPGKLARYNRTDTYSNGASTTFDIDGIAFTTANRMHVRAWYEVEEAKIYREGDPQTDEYTIASADQPPATVIASSTLSLIEVIEDTETLSAQAAANLSLSAQGFISPDFLSVQGSSTLSLTDTVQSPVQIETLTHITPTLLSLPSERFEGRFGKFQTGVSDIVPLHDDTVYVSKFVAPANGRAYALRLWVDGLGSALTGTAQLRSVVYAHTPGVGPTTRVDQPGAPRLDVVKGDPLTLVSIPLTIDLIQGREYWVGINVAGNDNVARVTVDVDISNIAYGPDPLPIEGTFPSTETSTSGNIDVFGYAQGNLVGASDETIVLDGIVAVGGQAIRTDLSWNANATTFNQAAWDKFMTKCFNRGLKAIPTIHPKNPTANDYALPNDIVVNGTNVIDAFQARYGPGGTFLTLYETERAKAVPGAIQGVTVLKAGVAQPITDYEIWNEPQTGTGNCTPTGSSLETNLTAFTKFVQFFKAAAASIKAHPTFNPSTCRVLGPALGGVDIDYANKMYSLDNDCFLDVDIITAHCYANIDPDTAPPPLRTGLPTTIGGAYKYTEAEIKRPRIWETLILWCDSHPKTAHLKVGMTEGGYSGSNETPVPPNVVTEALQSSRSGRWVDILQGATPNTTLLASYANRFKVFIPYNVVDYGVENYTGDGSQYQYTYWYENLGLVRGTLALKPWGTTYKSKVTVGGGSSTSITTLNSVLPEYVEYSVDEFGGLTTQEVVLATGSASPSLASEVVTGTQTSFPETLILLGAGSLSLTSELLVGDVEDAFVTGTAILSLIGEKVDSDDVLEAVAVAALSLPVQGGSIGETLSTVANAVLSLSRQVLDSVEMVEVVARGILFLPFEDSGQAQFAPDAAVLLTLGDDTVEVSLETGSVVIHLESASTILEM